uniref:hypothetical protein n=1 Tax=Nocardia cyriacigeorgica TaxID=135487 RepID=UPI002454E5CE
MRDLRAGGGPPRWPGLARAAGLAQAASALAGGFTGGYVGYLGYEVKAECGAAAAHRARTPDAQWIFADRLVVVDHVAGR